MPGFNGVVACLYMAFAMVALFVAMLIYGVVQLVRLESWGPLCVIALLLGSFTIGGFLGGRDGQR